MNSSVMQKIIDEYGDRAAVSEFERSLYSRDLAPVPDLLVKPLFKTCPDIVVRPASTEEVAELLEMAYSNNIPVTPRAGASTVYFDSVPTRSGILMDINLLRGIVALDEAGMTLKVKSATTWSELETFLAEKGLAPRSVPSSAPAATVGGWFCMMGYGIGSMKYGSFVSQVRSIEVVLPDGTVKWLSRDTNPSLEWFASSEGTMGIITELEVELRRLTPMRHFLLHLPDAEQMGIILDSIIEGPVRPYNMHFSDQQCLKALQVLGFSPAGIETGCVIAVDYEGTEQELEQAGKFVDQLSAANKNVVLLPAEIAELEWEERYRALKLKRGGPSVLGAEVWLPVIELPAYLEDVQKMSRDYNLPLISYGHVVTRDYATVMTTFYTDETKVLQYIVNLSLVKKIHDIGYRHGGHPYGTGLWNTPYLKRMHQPARLDELRKRKQAIDSKGIMNPGKVYRWPLMLNPFNFTVGMNVLAGIRRIFGKGW